MKDKRILYVSSEVIPYLPETEISSMSFEAPRMVNNNSGQIRIFMPRYGNINERRHQLHEVIRLSGMNLVINDLDMPLIIKVASIPKERMQVYFIDNEDYFKRKATYADEDGNFFEDNDERAIFFCKGVLETVKKLGWSPDIIHCNDWMTSLIPLYTKTTYKNDPIYKDAKTVFSIYNNRFAHKFGDDLIQKVKMIDIDDNMLDPLKTADYDGFVKLGIEYADAVINADEENTESFNKLIADLSDDKKTQTIESTENFEDSYYNLYNELIG